MNLLKFKGSQDFVSGEKNALELQRMHKRVENTLLRHDF